MVAIKIAEDMNRPCLLLRKHINPETGLVEMSGSARNVDHSPIDSLKDVISETNSFYGQKVTPMHLDVRQIISLEHSQN